MVEHHMEGIRACTVAQFIYKAEHFARPGREITKFKIHIIEKPTSWTIFLERNNARRGICDFDNLTIRENNFGDIQATIHFQPFIYDRHRPGKRIGAFEADARRGWEGNTQRL
jgi:hypothetical protein